VKSNTEKIAFIQSCFGSAKVARDGANVAVKCPACGEKKGKFSINIENWACHCWICGVKSKNLFFILKKHCDKSLALRFEKNFGSPESKKKKSLEEVEEEVSLPESFVHLASCKKRDPDIRAVIDYCRSRNISRRDMWYYGIGTGTEFKFRRRVIIPSFDAQGNLNYFVSRSIDKDRFPKYLNARSF
jgi:DNA primase